MYYSFSAQEESLPPKIRKSTKGNSAHLKALFEMLAQTKAHWDRADLEIMAWKRGWLKFQGRQVTPHSVSSTSGCCLVLSRYDHFSDGNSSSCSLRRPDGSSDSEIKPKL